MGAALVPVKVPHGYCPNHSTGVTLPDGWMANAQPISYAK